MLRVSFFVTGVSRDYNLCLGDDDNDDHDQHKNEHDEYDDDDDDADDDDDDDDDCLDFFELSCAGLGDVATTSDAHAVDD